MGDYNLAYTGSQVNAALAESARLVSEGGGVSAQELEELSTEISNTYALKTLIKRQVVSINLSGFTAASTGFYYKQFDFSGITSNNVISVHTIQYNGAWRCLVWEHYGDSMCLYTNLNTDMVGSVEVFYI